MQERPIDAAFNAQRTLQDGLVTELVLEAALQLILTQDANKANEPNHQIVPETADLKVFGDDVTILGEPSCPGRAVQIFSRLLRAKADGDVPPGDQRRRPGVAGKIGQPDSPSQGGVAARQAEGQAAEGNERRRRLQRPGSNASPLSMRRRSRARPAGRGRTIPAR